MNRTSASTNPQLLAPDGTRNNGDGIRPRNRRLVNTGQEQELVSSSGTSTPSQSRGASPIPSKYPSRSVTRSTSRGDGGVRGGGGGRPVGGLVVPGLGGAGKGIPQPQGLGGLWEGGWTSSWSALQSLASSVLGTDEGAYSGPVAAGKKTETWGPEGLPKRPQDTIGAGSNAERDAAVRQRRVRGVLEGRDEDLNAKKDTNGNYKARSSLDEARQDGSDENALVYVHHVQPNDTVAGVTLRYNCQATVVRKSNGFWNDSSIQSRKTIFIPVDACTVKGRPCEAPGPGSQGVDLLAPTPGREEVPIYTNGSGSWPQSSPFATGTSAERPEREEDRPWTHVRWVLIDSSPNSKPVQIARLPRKTLGYFPPRRRKSQGTTSTATTPSGSLEFPRAAPEILGSTPPSRRTSSNLGSRPTQPLGSYFPPAAMSTTLTRPRRESVGETADRLGWMRGPGGVGTFNKNVRRPGPSQDGLNAWAKKHIPGLTIDSLPSAALASGETASIGFKDDLPSIAEGAVRATGTSGTATPNGPGVGLGIENAAAAVEGWIRRLAVKGPGTPTVRGRFDTADLIELLDGTGSDDGYGRFELTAGAASSVGGREDLEGVVRGRITAGTKGGKKD